GRLPSLSAWSGGVVLRPWLLRQLARHARAMAVLYLVTGPLLAGWAVLVFLALRAGTVLLLPVAAMVGATVVLLYPRLLGRIAWLVAYHAPEPAKKGRKKKKRKAVSGAGVSDPWQVAEGSPPAGRGPREPP